MGAKPRLASPKIGPRRTAAEAAASSDDESWGKWKAPADDRRPRLTIKAEAAELLEATAVHPECTSGAGNCIGSTASRLVRHLLMGKAGDLYCEARWAVFYEQNPNTQGELLDEVV